MKRKSAISTFLKATVFTCAIGFASLGYGTEAKAAVFVDMDGNVVTSDYNGWSTIQGDNSGSKYWFDNGELARDKEVYDSSTDAWYWFDADGTMAKDKDAFIPTNPERTEGKWVRYDANGGMIKGESYANGGWYRFDEITGVMVKGWYTDTVGNLYYYDEITGQMVHGARDIDGVPCAFDDNTGVALNCQWYTIDGNEYWYEGGKRQGLEGRGKEIFDPGTNAWYWLDAIDGGRKAKGKDVYQESSGGKWVRYDENGGMIKGWDEQNGNYYYFDFITGAMIKGEYCDSEGDWYLFNEDTGIMVIGDVYRNDNWYYYDEETGIMAKGSIKRDGYTYKYDEITGVFLEKYEGDINYDNQFILTFENEFDIHSSYSSSGKLYGLSMITEWESVTKHSSYYDEYSVDLDCTLYVGYMASGSSTLIFAKYELLNEKGICIKNGGIIISSAAVDQEYLYSIHFYGLEPGKYTLRFSDYYY